MMVNSIEVVQVSKVNVEKSFVFKDDKNIDFPMEPLISAIITAFNTIKIRIVVFVDRENKIDPVVKIISEIEDTLSISVDYDYKDIKPSEYTCYYLEIDYSSDTVSKIKKINSKLIDTDPRTSRGTVTEVAI